MKRSAKIFLCVLAIGALLVAGFFFLGNKHASRQKAEQAQLAQEIQKKTVLDELNEESEHEPEASPAQPQPSSEKVPDKHLLAMPFYSQAPGGNWDKTHEEMCEEASLLNAGLYLLGKKLSIEEFDRELLKLKEIGEKVNGTWVSTTVSDTKKVSDAYFNGTVQSKIVDNPTISQIETEVSSGNPVIVPLAGREVGNPNYTPPGPIYHMLVIKGYDNNFFVTNDVGTRKGDSYVFPKNVIMEKMHDWNEKDIHLGGKKILVLMKK